jgi:hypothetical protein
MRAYTPFDRGGTRAMDARRANDRIADKAEELRFVSRLPMLCECGEPTCRAIVLIGLDEYHAIRSSDDSVLTAPGHLVEGGVLETQTSQYEVRRVGRRSDDSDGDRRYA